MPAISPAAPYNVTAFALSPQYPSPHSLPHDARAQAAPASARGQDARQWTFSPLEQMQPEDFVARQPRSSAMTSREMAAVRADAMRHAVPVAPPPLKSKERIRADFAVRIGMTAEALRRDPMPGLIHLFEHFSHDASRRPDRFFSVHPVRLGGTGFDQWHALFGIAAAEDDAGRRRARPELQTAIQELALDLLRSRHKNEQHLRNVCYRVYKAGLRKRKALLDLRAAIAAALSKCRRGAPLSTELARWMAQLALASYEPALGRLDAPDALVIGSVSYVQRHLAVINRSPNHPSHWLLPERTLLEYAPPPNAALGEIEFTALQFAYAHHRDYLRPALANPAADVGPLIAEHAVEDLRRSLRSAGIAGRLLPPGADGLEPLPQDWIGRIDWMAFNGAHFLAERGARAPYRNTFTWWILAIRDCFQPAAGLDVAQMDGGALTLFVGRIADSQAFGVNHADAWDAGFVRNLFDAFLRHHVAPLAAAPFERALYRATAPPQFLHCNDPDVAPGVPRILYSMNDIRENLRRELYGNGAPGVWEADRKLPNAEQRLVVECLCAMYAPALTLEEIPGGMAYGGIGHMMLELALLYPGVPMRNLTMEAAGTLLASESLATVMLAADSEAPAPEVSPVLTLIKRQAHANGVIDARTGALPSSAWSEALQFFESRTQPAVALDQAFNATMRAVVDRRQSIANLLTEMGYDPNMTFVIPAAPLAYFSLFPHPPLKTGETYTLQEVVLNEGVQQLLSFGDLNDAQTLMLQNILHRWPKKEVLKRCRRDFDKSLAGLIASKIRPALHRFVQELPPKEQAFWQCGKREIFLPRAEMFVRPNSSNGDKRLHPTENVIADGAVLLDLSMDGETLHYWISLQPLGLARYTCGKEELIKSKLPVFFSNNRPRAPGRKILGLKTVRNYYAFDGRDGKDVLTAIIDLIFTEEKIDDLYRMALGETDGERTENMVFSLIRSMVPGYGCAEAAGSPELLQSASWICALDGFALLPILNVGGKALRQISGIVQRAIFREVAAAGMGRLAQREAGRRLASAAGEMYSIAARSGVQTLGYLEPGIAGVAAFWRLGRTGLVALNRQIWHIAEMSEWSARITRILRLMDDIFPDGSLWRAKPKSIQRDAAGHGYLPIEGKQYEVVDLGDVEDVLVIPDGPGKVIPVNPETGLPCGFSQRRGGMLRSRKAPGRPAPPAAAETKLCRSRRGLGGAPSICTTLEPAFHIGPDYYSFPDIDSYYVYQTLPLEGGRLLEIDPASAAYRSYSFDGAELRARDVFYRDGILYRRAENGQLSIIDWDLEMDDTFFGSFSYENVLTREAVPKKAWYVRIKIDTVMGGEGRISMIGMAPYGDFIDADGSKMCMALLFDEPYVFKKQGAPRTNKKFKLRKASPEQIAIYESYAKINSYNYPPAISGSIRRLYNEPEYRAVVDTTLNRFESMLENAAHYYSSPDSNHFLRKFAPGEDIYLADRFRQRLLGKLDAIRKMLPHLKRHKDHLIAVADMFQRTGSYAVSLREGLIFPLDSALLNKPIVILDEMQLGIEPSNVVAAYLGHELFHAINGALDKMDWDSPLEFYAKLSPDGSVDLSQLFMGAQIPGFDPGLCASVLENCLSIGDAMARGDKRPEQVIFGGSSTYNRRGEFDWRQKRDGALPGEAKPGVGQLDDLGLISYSMLLALLPVWYEDLKKDLKEGLKKKI